MRLPVPAASAARAHVGGHHRLQRLRRVPAALREAPQRAGAGGEQDVVRRHAEAPPDRADLVQAPGDADVMAARRSPAGSAASRAPAAAACAPSVRAPRPTARGQRRAAGAARPRCRAGAERQRGGVAGALDHRAGEPLAAPTAPAPGDHGGLGARRSRQPSGSASSSRLPSSTTAAPSTMQWCILPTSASRPSGQVVGDRDLPQRPVARAAARRARSRRARRGPRRRPAAGARSGRSRRRRPTPGRARASGTPASRCR